MCNTIIKQKIIDLGFVYGTALTIGNEIQNIESSQELLEEVWKAGIRIFDTSNNYGNGLAEIYLGNYLSKKNRKEFMIFSKVGWPGGESPFSKGLSRDGILNSLDESLNRLSLKYLDIYFAHRYDPDVLLIEVIFTFNQLIKDKKILSWGISEWPLEILRETLELCRFHKLTPPIAEQFVYSYLIDKHELSGKRKILQELGLITIGYSPLAQGLLTGKYQHQIPNESRIGKSEKIGYNKTTDMLNANIIKLRNFINNCKNHNLDPIQAALCWVKSRNVIPILGFSKPEQVLNITYFKKEFCNSINWSIFNDF